MCAYVADVNECGSNTALCAPHGTCVDLPGSYTCDCPKGYSVNEQQCQGIVNYLLYSLGSLVSKHDVKHLLSLLSC